MPSRPLPRPAPLPTTAAGWFREHVQPHEPALRAYLHGLVRPVDVDDLVQETYYRILRAWASAESISSPRGLLFAIARNAARDLVRRRRVADPVPMTETEAARVFSAGPDVSEAVSRQQETELLAAAIAALPPRCREILVLRKFENLSHREIAQRLGIAAHTVEAQLTKALHRCEAFFARHGLPPR